MCYVYCDLVVSVYRYNSYAPENLACFYKVHANFWSTLLIVQAVGEFRSAKLDSASSLGFPLASSYRKLCFLYAEARTFFSRFFFPTSQTSACSER